MEFVAAGLQLKIAEGEPALNRERAGEAVAQAAGKGARLVVLPEMWTAGFASSIGRPQEFAETEDGVSVNLMRGWAEKHKVFLVGGSIPELSGGRVFNTVFFFDPRGKKIGRYRKAHLYPFGEEEAFAAGDETPVFKTELGKMALMTCYDIRFPELARSYALRGAETMVVVSNFTSSISPKYPRSKIHHWSQLLYARAIENQVYLIAVNCAGGEGSPYFGHSMILDPWGEALAAAGNAEEILYARLDTDLPAEIRQRMPALNRRRPEIYGG